MSPYGLSRIGNTSDSTDDVANIQNRYRVKYVSQRFKAVYLTTTRGTARCRCGQQSVSQSRQFEKDGTVAVETSLKMLVKNNNVF